MAQTLKFGKGTWATKTGSSMAYNDQNGNYKPLPFNVERDSIATRVNKQGLIEVVGKDKLRIDYTDSAKGVALLENSATNLFPYSEDFENSDWIKNAGTTITNNYAISPDGSLNASRYLGTGASGLGDKFTLNTTEYTISFWVKSNNGVNQFCRLIGDSSNVSSDLLITTEWTRLSYTFTGSGLSNKTNGIFRDSSDNDIDILIWGAQLEQNSVASSHIPTSGSTVQRQADVVNGSGNSEVFNDSEGVLFADISSLSDSQIYRLISISDGTNNNRVTLGYDNSTINKFYFQLKANSSNIWSLTIEKNINVSKIAFKYKSGQQSIFVNGFEVVNKNNSFTFSSNLKELGFFEQTTTNPFYGSTKEIGYYDATLTDSELEYLTSYRSLNELVTELNLNTL